MGEQERAAEEELITSELAHIERAREHELAGRRQLERGRTERAVREFELALEVDPSRATASELLLEAHRCRNAVYWALRGYWRWTANVSARWIAYPLFTALTLSAVGAEAGGGFAFLGDLPRWCEPNAVAKSVQIAAWCVFCGFILLHEHKSAWVLDRLATVWLVPADVRARCLSDRDAGEHRRAVAYALAVVALVVFLGAAVIASLWTDRLDDLWVGALALPLPIALALALPRGRTRNVLLLVLALASAGVIYESVLAWSKPREHGSLGKLSALAFAVGIMSAPVVLVLHARARRALRIGARSSADERAFKART